ncbi:hypothetical protein ASPFODRAFT_588578 [Aspergillus luchuensis CBS 106.47]|uniref:Uncharacterized protein n=1 Tax=Aspergillus luchuensis (strain CBS 106.47) TaxID=1137211 RepID=A0A1M3TLW4_ASPLC|nr:hypothetical protein ASPFODRAFT_588578 [Aspergillus luchuensis CBS 106.47]
METRNSTVLITSNVSQMSFGVPRQSCTRKSKVKLLRVIGYGPLSAFVEVWELKDGQPALRGSRIDVFPIFENPRNLVLCTATRLGHLLPQEFASNTLM